MLLRVQYRNNKYDYVNAAALSELITSRAIREFYRPSENKWIDIEEDPVRGAGGQYKGPERRFPLARKQGHPEINSTTLKEGNPLHLPALYQ